MTNQRQTERQENPISPNDVLRRQLADLARVFRARGTEVPVEWTDRTSHAQLEPEEMVNINPLEPMAYGVTGPDALRLLAGTVSHEAEHLRSSSVRTKQKYVEAHEGDNLAEGIFQVTEDQYIDAKRLADMPGLQKTHAFKIAKGMEMRPAPATLLEEGLEADAFFEAIVQRSYAGQVKNVEALPEEWVDAIDTIGDRIDTARDARRSGDRAAIAEEVTEMARRVIPPTEDIPPVGGGPSEGEEEGDGKASPDADGEPGDGSGEGSPIEGEFPDPTQMGEVGAEMAEYLEELREAMGLEASESTMDGEGMPTGIPNPDYRWQSGNSNDTEAPTDAEFDIEQLVKFWGVDPETDIYSDPDYDARYARMQTAIRRDETEYGRQQNERDRLAERHRHSPKSLKGHRRDDVQRVLRESGLIDEVREAFRQFKTADMYVDARQGDRLNLPNAIDYLSGNTGIEDLFYVQERAEVGDRAIGVTVDMSGSMSGDVLASKVALAAIATATDEIGDKFVANTYWSGGGEVTTTLITGPDEDFDLRQLDAMRSYGGDPMALGLFELQNLIDGTAAREKVIICITDGQPTVTSDVLHKGYKGMNSEAVDESAAYVRQLRSEGYLVFGLGLTGVDEDLMEVLFGEDWTIVNVNDLTETLIEIYRRQMVVSR